MRTIKEEVLWLNEFESFEEAKEKIDKWLAIDYNKLYVHSVLGYRSPEEFQTSFTFSKACTRLLNRSASL